MHWYCWLGLAITLWAFLDTLGDDGPWSHHE